LTEPYLIKGGIMNKVLLMVVCLSLAVVSVGCSTVKGVGEDISTIGGWLKKGSDDLRNK